MNRSKKNPRRDQVKREKSAERLSRLAKLVNTHIIGSVLLWLLFVVLCSGLVSFESIREGNYGQTVWQGIVILMISAAAGLYILHYQHRIIHNHMRAFALIGLFLAMLLAAKPQ